MDDTPSTQNRPTGRQITLLWFITFLIFSLLYLATCQRGVSWQDSGNFQWRILTGTYDESLGLALVHPLYLAIGRVIAAIPLGPVTARINALSGLAMAAALANLTGILVLLTGRRWIGLAAAAMLSVCHTVWWLASIAEVYTLNVALFTAELWLLVALLGSTELAEVRRSRGWLLVALALACGLDWSVHNMALLTLPVYVVAAAVLVVRRRLPAWSAAAAIAAFVAGASPYLVLIARQAWVTGDPLAATSSALFGVYQATVLNVSVGWPLMRVNAVLIAMNFTSFLPLLAVIGWLGMRRLLHRPTAYALAAITLIEVLFVGRYSVPDQFTFLLPSLVMIAVAAGLGAATLADASIAWRKAAAMACLLSMALPPTLYAAAPGLAQRLGQQVHRPRELPFRNELRYWLVPWKHNERSAELFARRALAQVSDDDVVLLDRTVLDTLRVTQKTEGLAPGVLLTDDEGPLGDYDRDPGSFRRALGGRRLFILAPVKDYVPDKLLANAKFVKQPDQVLYEVVWKSDFPTTSEPTRPSTPTAPSGRN